MAARPFIRTTSIAILQQNSDSPNKEITGPDDLQFFENRGRELLLLRDMRAKNGDRRRNEMLFAYAEVIVRCFDLDAARTLTAEYNEGFSSPLPVNEEESIFKSATRRREKHYWLYGASKFAEHLDLTLEEINALFQGKCTRSIESLKAKKRKEMRNAQIEELLAKGKKHSEIASLVGCSVGTVKNYVKSKQEQSAE